MKPHDPQAEETAPVVAVVGSLNMDAVLRLPRAPNVGETVLAHSLQHLPGGKGGNQAVGAARQGARVRLLARVGDDEHGRRLARGLADDGVDTHWVGVDAQRPTGLALILLEDDGQNRIVVHPGANAALAPSAAELQALLQGCAAVVMQFETPLELVQRVAAQAVAAGVAVVLNPSPCLPLPASLWPTIDLLVVNEVEAAQLAAAPVRNPDEAGAAAQALRARGCREVIVTLGAAGAVAADAQGCWHAPALPVPRVVDTTAAGDTFLGAVVAARARGEGLLGSMGQGLRAAAWCVQHLGAQPSIPTRAQLASGPEAPRPQALRG